MEKSTKQLIVSDHAVVRYLEQAEGLDIEAIRLRMQEAVQTNPRLKKAIDFSAPSRMKIKKSGGETYYIHGGVVSGYFCKD